MSITSSGDIAPAVAPLVARTVALDGPSADLALLTVLPRHDALAWIRHGEGIVGWGEVTRITTHGAARFSQAAQWWRDLSEHAIVRDEDRKSTRLNSSHVAISYAVFCLKKKN